MPKFSTRVFRFCRRRILLKICFYPVITRKTTFDSINFYAYNPINYMIIAILTVTTLIIVYDKKRILLGKTILKDPKHPYILPTFC